jgi:hypothetical protein
MELSAINHIEPVNLDDFEADVFITTLGFESRCTSTARLIEHKSCPKIALSRTDHIKDFSFHKNRDYYLEQGYEIIRVDTKVPDFRTILQNIPKEKINILLDCTSMSQRWYHALFSWLSESLNDYATATLRFVYSMAGYTDSGPARKIKKIREIHSRDVRSNAKEKKALILGLGHEEKISETIYKMVNPDLLYLYYADPPVDKQFVEKVFVNNHALIDQTPIRNLIAYPIRNGQTIYQSLTNTILPLRDDYSILLIPQGPKIFSVVSMLVYLGYPDIHLSYPVFKKPPAVDRQPSGEAVVLDILFEGEE